MAFGFYPRPRLPLARHGRPPAAAAAFPRAAPPPPPPPLTRAARSGRRPRQRPPGARRSPASRLLRARPSRPPRPPPPWQRRRARSPRRRGEGRAALPVRARLPGRCGPAPRCLPGRGGCRRWPAGPAASGGAVRPQGSGARRRVGLRGGGAGLGSAGEARAVRPGVEHSAAGCACAPRFGSVAALPALLTGYVLSKQ